MTSEQRFLLNAKAAHAARTRYQLAAVRLTEMADDLRRDGWRGWARQVDEFASCAARAARAEVDR